MNFSEKVEAIAEMSIEALFKTGQIIPSLFVVGDQNVAMIVMQGFGPSNQDRIEQLFAVGKTLAENNERPTNIGLLEGAVLVTESWMSQVSDPDVIKVMPEDDPDRKEAVVVVGQDARSDTNCLFIYEMLRNKAGQLIDAVKMDIPSDMQPDRNLLDAFAAGYYSTNETKN